MLIESMASGLCKPVLSLTCRTLPKGAFSFIFMESTVIRELAFSFHLPHISYCA